MGSNNASPQDPVPSPPASWRRMLNVCFPATYTSGDPAVAQTDWRPDSFGEYCPRCGATAAAAAITINGCPHCRGQRIAWHGLWRLGAYKSPLSEWVVAYKFHGRWKWGRWFGTQLAKNTPDHDPAVVVPVPLHWRRRLHRGYDQAAMIAGAFAAAKGLPTAKLLRRRRPTPPQSTLRGRTQRLRNVRTAFTIRPIDLHGWSVWLVDDVKTSGSTARACTQLLRRAGAERVYLAAAAVADPRNADFQRK